MTSLTVQDHSRLASQAVDHLEKSKQDAIKRGDTEEHQRMQFAINETKRMVYENVKALEGEG